jgi:hypothetical protein
MLTRWTKKIHMYAGLLNFTILMVFGVAGIRATLQTPRQGATEVETRQFRVPPNLDDFQAAQAAFQFVNAPLSQPPTQRNVHRDGQNDVTFDMGTINGPRTVTLIETQDELRIETHRNRLSAFIDNMHATTMNTTNPDIRIRMWSWYTEFSIWSLIFMSLSGVYLWLSSRPGYRWAQLCFGIGSAAFVLLYILVR